jgi:ankyrin repeat protein
MNTYSMVAISCCLGLIPSLVSAQTPVVLSGREAYLWEHAIGPREAIHVDHSTLKLTPFEMFGTNVELEVVVSPNGRVNEAHAITGPREVYERAEQIELARSFKPFTHDGMLVTARIHDYVSVAPPEVWLPKPVPFPAEVDMSTVIMSLGRTGCFGTCPAYRVSVSGNGSVTFDGDSNVLVPGHHTARISPAAARDLFNAFRKADFLSAQDEYSASVTDMPSYRTSLTVGGSTKRVSDYDGIEVGMPDAVRDLERQIDETADTERWVKGNADTFRSLKAEQWDFGSSRPDNMALYRSAISRGDKQLVDTFVAAKAPIDIPGTRALEMAPVCVASTTGDLALVQRMLSVRKPISKDVLQPCLAAAARGGNVDILDLWLARGADATAQPPRGQGNWGNSILADGISSGKAEVVQRLLDYQVDLHERINGYIPLVTWAVERAGDKADIDEILTLLVKAGASVNERGHLGQTPLFAINFHPATVKTLIALGARVDARDDNGDTPLINSAFVPAAVQELLSAGADPTIANKDGHTALEQALQFRCLPCANAIVSAIKRRAETSSH